MKWIASPSKILAIAGLLLVVAGFQNCSNNHFGSNDNSGSSNAQNSGGPEILQGNGDSYTGKPQHYLNTDPNSACSQLTASGQPFPNREIFFIGGQFKLVRDNCQDVLPPVLIPGNQIQVATGNLVYQGRTFNVQNDLSAYQVIPKACPVGRSVINNNPVNLAPSPMDLLVGWNNHTPDVQQSLFSSISALPLYQVTRTGPALESWQRMSDNFTLKANTVYAFSFLLRAGNVDHATLDLYNIGNGTGDHGLGFVANLNDGTVVLNNVNNVAYYATTSQRYGAGWNFTVFFDFGTGLNQYSDIGVSTWSPSIQVGDFIYASAPTMFEVSTYCSP